MNRQFCSKLPSESDDVFIFNLYSAIESESLVVDELKKTKNDLDQMKVEGLLLKSKRWIWKMQTNIAGIYYKTHLNTEHSVVRSYT